MPAPDGPLVAKIGNITQPVVLRVGKESGKPWTALSIVEDNWVPKGEPKPEPKFYEVKAFGSLAENVCQVVKKGDRVLVIGRGQTETYTNKEGIEKSKKVILADEIGLGLRFGPRTSTPKQAQPPAEEYPESEEPF